MRKKSSRLNEVLRGAQRHSYGRSKLSAEVALRQKKDTCRNAYHPNMMNIFWKPSDWILIYPVGVVCVCVCMCVRVSEPR